MQKKMMQSTALAGKGLFLQISILTLSILFIPAGLFAQQIYEPEGLNLPGAWNSWQNPPVNNLALASATQTSGGRVTKINIGTPRWQTWFSVAASGADLAGGTYNWLFTSGPTSNPWMNKWAGVNVQMNTLQNYTYNSGADNSVTLINGKWYTVNWRDNGYAGTQAIFMETSTQPANLLTLPTPSGVLAGQPVTITLTLDAVPSPEEIFYLRYTTNAWNSSTAITFNMTGTTGTAIIPGQNAGTVVEYYAFSSTVTNITSNYDMLTLKFNNNNGSNYTYTVNGLSNQAEILSFTLPQQTGPAVINSAAATVTIEVAHGTDVSNLIPTITISNGATISPASGVAQNFTNPVVYTVTAQDGTTTKQWTVTVTVAPPVPIGWANLQWPPTGNIQTGEEFIVYARVWANGLTNQPGATPGMQAWIGYHTSNTDPSGWTNWIPATYLGDVGNDDEYNLDLGGFINTPGVYYYASRFSLNGQPYVYGGYSGSGGGFWDGTNYISGQLTVTSANKTLDVTIMLEGPFNGTDMNTNLLSNNLLPAAQPYDEAPWNYAGSETVTSFPAQIVDWVLVELRAANTPANATPATVLPGWPKALLLRKDGKIVDLAGNLPNIGNPTVNGNLYVVVRHRNHIDVMSNFGASLSGNTFTYNFTTGINQAYGGNSGFKQLTDDVYGMVIGDADGDGQIFTSDYNLWASGFGSTNAYLSTDFDMDGNVFTSDYNKWASNFGFNFIIQGKPSYTFQAPIQE